MTAAQAWIKTLQLKPHPEGGYYREAYRSSETIAAAALPARFGGDRALSTAIYFLLPGDDFSALHRIRQDEVWHFYDGAPLTIDIIDPSGGHRAILLGRNLQAGEVPQTVVPAGCYFGARLRDPHSYALVGCTVAPGFDFADFELPTRDELCALFPQHRDLIAQLTR